MIFIPAIDLIDGKCVRLTMGDYSKKKEYSANPVDVARRFVDEGAKYLHIVDLDSAKDPMKDNISTVEKIVKSIDIPVEVGGGIRSREKAENLFSIGVERIIIGTILIKNQKLVKSLVDNYHDKIIASIDVKDENAYISGWLENGGLSAIELGLRAKELGISTVIFTDIKRDGTLSGPDIEGIKNYVKKTGLSLIVAGGINNKQDLLKIKELGDYGVIGVISGKAIYEGKIKVREAVEILG